VLLEESRMNRKVPWMAISLFASLGSAAFSAEKASDLRRQLARAETEFYALYNKLNTERRFDMLCHMDRATGTAFTRRVCEPRYYEEARMAAASEEMQAATHASSSAYRGNGSGDRAAPNSQQEKDYFKNMRKLLENSPELQALQDKLDALRDRLDEIKASKARGDEH
jgi:hypothetical protein